jgi:hypothetical protein
VLGYVPVENDKYVQVMGPLVEEPITCRDLPDHAQDMASTVVECDTEGLRRSPRLSNQSDQANSWRESPDWMIEPPPHRTDHSARLRGERQDHFVAWAAA